MSGSISNFDFSLKRLLEAEGGYSYHGLDRGGATNFGITQKTLARYRNEIIAPRDVQKLTRHEAEAIYLMEYWRPLNLDLIESKELCCLIFDQGVNRGPATAIKMLQRALGNGLKIDGVLGPNTAKGANETPTSQLLLQLIKEAQKGYFDLWRASPAQGVFLRGWIARTWKLFELL